MNLFLCTTPFQLFLAKKIIEELKIKSNEVSFLYLSNVENTVVKNSINTIIESGFKIEHLKIKKEKRSIKKYIKKIHIYTYLLKNYCSKKYDGIYLASIDTRLFYFILSKTKFEQLFTFDDGTANITPESVYYKNKEKGIAKKTKEFVFRIKYDMKKVKEKSSLHYTVYKNYKNIIENTKFINLFEKNTTYKKKNTIRKTSCSVILGTVYPEAFEKNINSEEVVSNCVKIIKKNGFDLFYIPHPRDISKKPTEEIIFLEQKNIAEKEIEQLLEKYDSVYIYGFMSSCQFNLESYSRDNNNVFFSKNMKKSLKETIKSNILPEKFKIINID